MINLGSDDSVISQLLVQLRSVSIQTDRLRFRTNLKRIGSLVAYEISRKLTYESVAIQTPLQTTVGRQLLQQPVLLPVMRAGFPYFEGFLEIFPDADCGFIGAFRKGETGLPEIQADYMAIPELNNRDVILIDPMLATGNSIAEVLPTMLQNQRPNSMHFASVVSAPQGVAKLEQLIQSFDFPATAWTCAIDATLDERYFIVPGLGDAGDLSFGNKR